MNRSSYCKFVDVKYIKDNKILSHCSRAGSCKAVFNNTNIVHYTLHTYINKRMKALLNVIIRTIGKYLYI